MATEVRQEEMILQSIKSVRKLRSCVSNLFSVLNEGLNNTNEEKRPFINILEEEMQNLETTIEEIDQLSLSLIPAGTQLQMGNCGSLSLDPLSEQTPLYSQLLQTYKWTNKLQEHFNLAVSAMNQSVGLFKKKSVYAPHLPNKRFRRNVSVSKIGEILNSLKNMFPDMLIEQTNNQMGYPAILKINLGKTFKAFVALRWLMLDQIVVRGFDEFVETSKIDMWTPSKRKVFRQITEHLDAAMLHFYAPQNPEAALKSFLVWLHSYVNLFSEPCSKCSRILQDNLPPTWRDFRTHAVTHPECRP